MPGGIFSGNTEKKNRNAAPAQRSSGSAVEYVLLGLFCLAVVSLQVTLYLHSGSFWRDETYSIQVAGSASFASMWAELAWDSFPGLFVGLLRGWILAGPGATDAGVRLFGALIALGCTASLMLSFRVMNRSVPLIALALIALNGTIFYFGSSIRAYGLAVLLIAPCFAAFWRVASAPTRLNVFASFVIALLTAHCCYQNSCILLGIGAAGAFVCALVRLWKRALLILSICFSAALSMLVYIPVVRAFREVQPIPTTPAPWSEIYGMLAKALAGTSAGLLVVWGAAVLAALILMPYAYYRERGSRAGGRVPSFALFSFVALFVGAVSGAVFFRANMMTPNPWHFTPFIALAAIAADIGFNSALPGRWRPLAASALACVIIGFSAAPVWQAAQLRRTNLDLVSEVLAREAGPDDLILVTSFWLSPGFNYLYRGKTEWNVLPLLPAGRESRVAFGAPLKKVLASGRIIEPALEKVEKTLRAGHRVWCVAGWNSDSPWLKRFVQFLQEHVTQVRNIPIPAGQSVNDLENCSLFVVEGWR